MPRIAKKERFLASISNTADINTAAKDAEIERTTHYRWLKQDRQYRNRFAHALEEGKQNLIAEAKARRRQFMSYGLAHKQIRLEHMQERWSRLHSQLHTIIEERGADMIDIPGGESGLLCRDYRGKDCSGEVYRVDSGLVSLYSELRAIERAAGELLGELSTQVEFSGSGGGPIEIQVEFVRPPAQEEGGNLKLMPGKAG